ncbi:MAG: DUF6933 domain-containing protein [Thermoleophilia bacterium]
MFVLRCTKKLLERMGPPSSVAAPSTTVLGDWFAQPVAVGRQRLILLASEHSRLPVVMPGRDAKNLARNLPTMLTEVLDGLGAPISAVVREIEAMNEAVIAVTNNRSVLGTLNDFSHMLKWHLAGEPDADLVEAALWLSETPVGPLGHDPPSEVTLRLLREAQAPPGRHPDPRAHTKTDALAPLSAPNAPAARDHPLVRAWTGNTWITDMRHFLDSSGDVPDMPGPALSLALFLGSIVAWATSGRTSADVVTNVSCRRSPGRRRCLGIIEADLTENGHAVSWLCPVCGDNGVTRGWEGTLWDRRRSRIR